MTPSSKQAYLHIVDKLVRQGAQGVILGCTEIGLLVNQQDTAVVLYDTMKIHAKKAVDWALGE
jgi:aspartate racemase